MESNSVKNIVVLRSLPSNIIDEAIIILKSNKYAKKFQMIEKNNKKELEQKSSSGNEYIIKEAEALLSSYVSKIEEDNKHIEKTSKTLKEKYKRLKKYSIIMTIFFFISLIINFG